MKSVSQNKNNMHNKSFNLNSKLYLYDVKGKLVKTTTIKEYSKSTNKTTSNIINIASSFKGYGFDNNHFISLKPIERLLTSSEVMKMFNKWLLKGYDRNITKLKAMYKTKFDEEYYSLAMLYVVEAIKSERSVNDFEQALIYKYRTSMLDSERANKLRKDNGLSSDFAVGESCHKNNDVADVSLFIETLAEEGDSIFDVKKNYDCVEDYNSIKRFDVIGYILKESFSIEIADLFVEMLQAEYDFADLKTIPNFKYLTLIRKYKAVIESIKMKDVEHKKLSNSAYLKLITEKCWQVFVNNISRIKTESERHTFKSVEDYGLYEIINN